MTTPSTPAPSSLSSTLPLSASPPPTYNHTPSNLTHLLHLLSQSPSPIPHTSTPSTLLSASNTPHSPALPSQLPKLIFYPQSTADVSHLLSLCHAHSIAVTSLGGGTSLGGALAATRGGVCVDFRDMGRVLEVHDDDLDVVVQPNVGWVELNRELEGRGLFFPPDPAPGARVGGMIAMSCSGTNAYRYGTMKEWVISLTCVLADGTVIKTRNRPRKSSAGYDLTHLVIGSEGTLALVTEAVLKLTALPKNLHVGMVSFETMQQGVDAAIRILKSGHLLEAIELADRATVKAINHSGLVKETLAEHPTLFLKFAGSKQSVREQIQFVSQSCNQGGLIAHEFSDEKERIDVIWGARKSVGHALVSMKKDPSDLFLHTDAAVPISKMAELVEKSDRIAQEGGWFCASVGHVGDGNVHTAIVCSKEDKAAAEKLLARIQKLALELDGTITGEHGVGLKLRDLLTEEVGQEGVDAMRKIKFALDPKGILNPDKVVRLEVGI